jgi:hypothetical protein
MILSSAGVAASARSADTAAPGLSKVHIKPQSVITAYLDASYLSLQTPCPLKGSKSVKRKEIQGFSRQSRKRFMDHLAKTRKETKPYLITLTYPQIYPTDPDIYKAHFHKFVKRSERRFGTLGGYWKLEFQKRGAPHYHLIVWLELKDILINEYNPWLQENLILQQSIALNVLKHWVSQAWFECVQSNDSKHLVAGTRVETVRDNKDIMAYAAKYIGKLEQGIKGVRYWGYFGKKCIPYGMAHIIHLPTHEATFLKRWMRRYAKFKTVVKQKTFKELNSNNQVIREYKQWVPTKVKSNYAKMNLPSLTVYCNANRWFQNVERQVGV